MEPGALRATEMRLSLFGSPRLEGNGASIRLGRRKSLALLAYLAVTGQPHDRAALTTLFWPESDRVSARAALRQCLAEINCRLTPALLHLDGQMVSLATDAPLWVDVIAFRHHLAAAQDGAEPDHLLAAADLYQTEFMTDFVLPDCLEFERWQRAQATLFKQEVRQALAEAARLLAAQQRSEEAIACAVRRANLDPLDEAAQAELLRLYLRDGQVATAAQHYEWFAAHLKAEVGRSPAWDLVALQPAERPFPNPSPVDENNAPDPLPGDHVTTPMPLPRLLAPFAGRARELTEVVARMRQPDCALLSLLGPGGVGKTALALAVAHQLAPDFDQRVYFVPLAAVDDRKGLLTAVAQALDVTAAAANGPLAAIGARLQDVACLLVLDNFEQLADEAGMLTSLLQAAPGLKLLVTSRCRLKLHEEWPFPLYGLAYPAEPDAPGAETYEAVAFLAQAIRRHAPHFPITAAHTPDLVQICRLVEGLPLGLELAAAWVGRLTLPQIAALIAQQPQQLTAVWDNTPDRHSSLEQVCAHSWQMLDTAERQAAQWLTLFPDGFTSEGAAALGVPAPLLAALRDKSLVQPRAAMEENGRFQMHEVIRRYVQSVTEFEGTTLSPAWRRYTHYYATFLQERDAWLQDNRQLVALAAIQAELVNVRAAWRQAATERDFEATSTALAPLYRFYRLKGLFRLGIDDFSLALTQWQTAPGADCHNTPMAEARLIARLFIRLGLLQAHLAQLEPAENSLQAGLAWLSGQDQEMLYEKAVGLNGLARVAGQRRAWGAARQFYEESLAVFRALNASLEMAQSLSGLGHVACAQGLYDEAQRLDEESLAIYRQLGNTLGMAAALNNLSHVAEMAGNYPQAKLWLYDSLKVAQKASAHWLVAVAFSNLAHIASLQETHDEAKKYLAKSLHLRQQHLLPGIGKTRESIAAIDRRC